MRTIEAAPSRERHETRLRTIEDIEADLAEAEAKYAALDAARRAGEGFSTMKRQMRAESAALERVLGFKTERERLLTGWQPVPKEELERAFPYAKHRAIVEFQGRRFRALYSPAKETPRGQPVKKWLREWAEVRDAYSNVAPITSAQESTTDAL